ncbi:hypothetical protein ACEQPO_05470 [Bacillus sp. SL00103]
MYAGSGFIVGFYEAFDKDHIKRLKKQGLYKRKMKDKTPLLSMQEVENGAFLEKSFDLQSEFIDILKDICARTIMI